MGVAGEHCGVVAIDQRRKLTVGIAPSQRGDEWRGAHQIADVVAADDEDAHATWRRAVGSGVPPPGTGGSGAVRRSSATRHYGSPALSGAEPRGGRAG